jgi:ADP-ribose pyrophosphatase YjhB (NUDIX family)
MLSANIHEIMQVLFRACNGSLSATSGPKQSRKVQPMMPENLPRVGSALLVRDEAHRILLGKRNKDPQRGNWVIPGGKIHPFETISEAGVRELREETGLSVAVGDPFRVYEIVNPPNEHRLVVYSWATVVGGILTPSDDLSEVDFFRPDEVANLPLTPLVRQVLHDAQILGHSTFTPKERSHTGRVRKRLQRRESPGTGALDFQGSIAIR